MKLHFMKKMFIMFALLLCVLKTYTQQAYTLQECLEYAIENNRNLKKSDFEKQKAHHARQEVLGSLLPQINSSASLNNNLKKSKFIMPNFINDMLPPDAQDPNAEKYMTIEMGTNYNANIGVTLNQQILNFPLFNALGIAKTAERMAALGLESDEEDVISQTANLFYAVQSTEYAVLQMDKSVKLVKEMLKTMEVNYENGLAKKVDVDGLKVNLVNMTTQKSAIENAAVVQKNLLKLQMGFEVNNSIEIESVDLALFEDKAQDNLIRSFSLHNQTPYRMMMENLDMAQLQKKSAIYENLPSLSLMFNYQYNGVSDDFFRGETNYWYPSSLIGLNMQIPIFSGFSRRAKIRQSNMEIYKAQEDVKMLEQSLNMAYMNANINLDDAINTIKLQSENQALAEEVFTVTENNFVLGLSSMSDILNASQSLVQAQLSYANALNDYMKAYIELKKAAGNIRDLMNEN